jgi:hypothetical protein
VVAEFLPVTDLADAFSLVDDEVALGYQLGASGFASLGSWASRAVWHGWRNGRVGAGLAEPDAAQVVLAHRWQLGFGCSDSPMWH